MRNMSFAFVVIPFFTNTVMACDIEDAEGPKQEQKEQQQ